MFSYYGSKTNLIKRYPKPKHGKIIEPFAGSASYSLLHFENDVTIVDKYSVITDIWHWLKQCSVNDILTLPIPGENETTHTLDYDCEAAKNFVGFIISYACFSPARKQSSHYLQKRTNGVKFQLNRVANDLFKIRHWNIVCASYDQIPNELATWFIDPPYQFGGHKYVESNKNIDFPRLGGWCREREGQVIVCETMKADWLPFVPMAYQRTRNGSNIEGIWTNEKTSFGIDQLQLFNTHAGGDGTPEVKL